MLSDVQFADLVTRRYEPRGVEFKPPGRRDDSYLFAQVTRAALGMANTRDGGIVVVGVEENAGVFSPVGLSAEQLVTWRYDDVAARFASYADPAFTFDLNVYAFDGKVFVALEVQEFADIPIICRSDYQRTPTIREAGEPRTSPPVLRAGACYVRSFRKPETSEIPGQSEMRELLDMAIDKGVKRFIARARAAGLDLPGSTIGSLDDERYARQLRDTEGA